jgi:hypothetical protein
MDEDKINELKPAINNFLWAYLPNQISLEEADKVALDIYNRIVTEHKKFI